ncbi:hypothetical protein ACR3IL_10575 [Streptococcus iniae]|nr:hypothetical protein BKX95_11570 [Streptococcus iniae]
MSNTRTEADKKLLYVKQEFAELLLAYKYQESWTKAGELNALLKNKENLSLPEEVTNNIASLLKGYYDANDKVNEAHKRMTGFGHKLQEIN